MNKVAHQLILASQSPRRASLLSQLGLSFLVQPAGIDESVNNGEAVSDYVMRMALEKANSVDSETLPVLAADTVVVFQGELFGKPEDKAHAMQMLFRLSNNTHQVYTAMHVRRQSRSFSALSISEVTFRKISDTEIERYWDTGEPCDKAGGYGIQGVGGVFVERISGSHSGIMGLALCETEQLLQQVGVDSWRNRI